MNSRRILAGLNILVCLVVVALGVYMLLFEGFDQYIEDVETYGFQILLVGLIFSTLSVAAWTHWFGIKKAVFWILMAVVFTLSILGFIAHYFISNLSFG